MNRIRKILRNLYANKHPNEQYPGRPQLIRYSGNWIIIHSITLTLNTLLKYPTTRRIIRHFLVNSLLLSNFHSYSIHTTFSINTTISTQQLYTQSFWFLQLLSKTYNSSPTLLDTAIHNNFDDTILLSAMIRSLRRSVVKRASCRLACCFRPRSLYSRALSTHTLTTWLLLIFTNER